MHHEGTCSSGSQRVNAHVDASPLRQLQLNGEPNGAGLPRRVTPKLGVHVEPIVEPTEGSR